MEVFEIIEMCTNKYLGSKKTDYNKGDLLETIGEMSNNDFQRFVEEIKQLQHHKDTSIGLYCFDCEPKDLIDKFINSQSDALNIPAEYAEQFQKDWELYCEDNERNIIFKLK